MHGHIMLGFLKVSYMLGCHGKCVNEHSGHPVNICNYISIKIRNIAFFADINDASGIVGWWARDGAAGGWPSPLTDTASGPAIDPVAVSEPCAAARRAALLGPCPSRDPYKRCHQRTGTRLWRGHDSPWPVKCGQVARDSRC